MLMSVLKKYQKEWNVKILINLISIICLCGCVQTQRIEDFELPNAPELKMREVKWEVLFKDNETKMCLSPQYYSNLSLNTQDIQVFMIYQNKIIKIYKEN